jgi:hypothetical protein
MPAWAPERIFCALLTKDVRSMTPYQKSFIGAATVCALFTSGSIANAVTIPHSENVKFQFVGEGSKTVHIPKYPGVLDDLNDVTIEIQASGSVVALVDNDDPYVEPDVEASLMREWTIDGPKFNLVPFSKNVTESASLGMDDTDGGSNGDNQEYTAPDGHEFNLSFDETFFNQTFTTDLDAFVTGPGDVEFVIDPTVIMNQLIFTSDIPAEWQREIKESKFKVNVLVTYDAEVIPEPGALALLVGGLPLLLRRRRLAA